MTSEFSCEAVAECPGFPQPQQDDDGRDDGDYADDATWILTSSFVILTMQSGFGLLEMGSSVPGSAVNIMLKNVFDVVFGALSYYMLGYGISYGNPSSPFMGLGDYLPDSSHPASADSIAQGLLYSTYIFQFSFAATSTTIVSGAIAMRMRFFVYCAFSFYAVIAYSFVAHWAWAKSGWLKAMGYHDFAGSGPVHLFGAMNGLVGILFVGPRTGRFDESRPKSDFYPASPTSQLFGLFMLWWGWIGFNCGSSFGITHQKWLVATRTAITTINSTSGGGIAALIYTQVKTKGKQVLPTDIVNGVLGSLVAITASCASVHPPEALVIGAFGSLIALLANDFIEHKLKLDDPVGAVGVHGAAAVWGILSVGLFADGDLPAVDVEDGLFRGGGLRLFGVQVLGIVCTIGWSLCCTAPFFYFVGVLLSKDWFDPRFGLRIGEEEELHGADKSLHGCHDDSAKNLVSLLEKSGYFNKANRHVVGNAESGSDDADANSFEEASTDDDDPLPQRMSQIKRSRNQRKEQADPTESTLASFPFYTPRRMSGTRIEA